MINLERLKAAAERDGRSAVVSRSFLRQVHRELSDCRAAESRRQCFGLKPGEQL